MVVLPSRKAGTELLQGDSFMFLRASQKHLFCGMTNMTLTPRSSVHRLWGMECWTYQHPG